MKYELTDITKTLDDGTIVHRIRAMRNIGATVNCGDLGGWVESRDNLSQEGSCWIFDDAVVYGNAGVHCDALVCERAVVKDNALISLNAVADCSAVVGGNARIAGNAFVTENAVVKTGSFDGQAVIGGEALIENEKDWCHFENLVDDVGNIYSLTAYLKRDKDIGVIVQGIAPFRFARDFTELLAIVLNERGGISDCYNQFQLLAKFARSQMLR